MCSTNQSMGFIFSRLASYILYSILLTVGLVGGCGKEKVSASDGTDGFDPISDAGESTNSTDSATGADPNGTSGDSDAGDFGPFNILFILADDLGVMDVGAYNPETFYETPSLDKLADEGLLSIEANSILGRVPGDRSGALCRGTQIRLQFDESKFTAGNMYLFASVLDRFLSLYCNINSFVQTVAVSNRRQGVTYRWPARAGLQRVV